MSIITAVAGSRAAVGALSFAAVGALALASGGYFATSWGWATLTFAAVAIASLQLSARTRLMPLELAALGALAGVSAWIALATVWSESLPLSLVELERSFVPLAALAAALLVARRETAPALALGVLSAAVVLAAWGLVADVSRPLGYANALAAVCAVGIVLAAGAAVEWRKPPVVAACSGAVILFAACIERSESRAAWLALA